MRKHKQIKWIPSIDVHGLIIPNLSLSSVSISYTLNVFQEATRYNCCKNTVCCFSEVRRRFRNYLEQYHTRSTNSGKITTKNQRKYFTTFGTKTRTNIMFLLMIRIAIPLFFINRIFYYIYYITEILRKPPLSKFIYTGAF